MKLQFNRVFVPKVKSGRIIHAIFDDIGKSWGIGRSIEFYNLNVKYGKFASGKVTNIQEIIINNGHILLDMNQLTFEDGEIFAKNCGFDNLAEFFEAYEDGFKGSVLHWTNYVYTF